MEKPVMTPAPGERLLRFVGDLVRFDLRCDDAPPGSIALLRTNLGKADATRREIISSYAGQRPLSVAFWRDIPMRKVSNGNWSIELPVTDIGFFRAKAYLVTPEKKQVWPDGPNAGISTHPDCYRTANTIYCAFTRLFGESRFAKATRDEVLESKMRELDERGFAVIPPSGKFRDVIKQLPHIVDKLGCKILHLLPVNPTPTTMARMGRFGSPYACLDLTAIDPALVEFDQRTNAVDQFCELTYATHARGAKVFLDVVINHTGWGSTLFDNHPEWFLREGDGKFASPGAWGNIWADLVELNPNFTGLWEHLAEAFLTWCRRGVDGFRCDAGYKVPLPVWQYIEARVRQEFPETLFLLEGLGGSWDATENLLTEGGMQWAYSELFQNYSGAEVQWYLDYALKQSERVGVYVHYSETHDNDRLAKKGRDWSLLRNRLCGLTSVCGGFGFTCGVEWLAAEKIEVHQSRGLSWDNKENIIRELAQLNKLLATHPAFFDSAKLTRLSEKESPVYALRRDSAEGKDSVLVLVNNDAKNSQTFVLDEKIYRELGEPKIELLEQAAPQTSQADGKISFTLRAGAGFCFASTLLPQGLSGKNYRREKAQAAWAISALSNVLLPEEIGLYSWRELARRVDKNPAKFLAAIYYLKNEPVKADLIKALDSASKNFPNVVRWTLPDRNRTTPVPPNHWLLLHDTVPFRATLKFRTGTAQHANSIPVADGHVAFFPSRSFQNGFEAELSLERYANEDRNISAAIRFLSVTPQITSPQPTSLDSEMVLLTNGIGGMARMCVDLGRVNSKYDCLLGANLHPKLPTDRHVFAKRVRVWVNADGFITPLNLQSLESFEIGPPATWRFLAKAGNERIVEVHLTADMLNERNTTVLQFQGGHTDIDVRLIVRIDIEDRNFHTETHRNPGTEFHFTSNCQPLKTGIGFEFSPAKDRQLRVVVDGGLYHHEAEWSENILHPVERTRGQIETGDTYSPGWFELPLTWEKPVTVKVSAETNTAEKISPEKLFAAREVDNKVVLHRAKFSETDSFGRRLALAAKQFIVRRGAGKTVIAGYPWFLDWGRDTMICARGLLAAGHIENVTEILINFGRFVENGTMPNTIHGEDASNRDTSDAPLWYGVVCEEAAALHKKKLYELSVDSRGRTIADVLREIAIGYINGTPNGIRMDAASGLIWSPSHFTWMDTNHPAGTPREGYPIEIQILWIRLLRQLEKLERNHSSPGLRPPSPLHPMERRGQGEEWPNLNKLIARAETSLQKFYWLEGRGYFSDLLIAKSGQPAAEAIVDNALRSNYLLAVSFGFVTGEKAQRCVEAALRYLVIPGALRTLAPLPVVPPLPIFAHDHLINNPDEPYWGHYEGDEDTRRKPAYHNGTAWTWTFPIFCEALATAWNFSPEATSAAKSYLGSMEQILMTGCLGQIPEIVDGDFPHAQRGCDAQAWGVTEALRVWKLLNR